MLHQLTCVPAINTRWHLRPPLTEVAAGSTCGSSFPSDMSTRPSRGASRSRHPRRYACLSMKQCRSTGTTLTSTMARSLLSGGRRRMPAGPVPLTLRARLALIGPQPSLEKVSARQGRVFEQSAFYVSHQFRRLRDAMKLPTDCVLHSTRHTFCSRLGSAGVSAYQIMRLAGHSSVAVSQRYVHEDIDALKGAIAQL